MPEMCSRANGRPRHRGEQRRETLRQPPLALLVTASAWAPPPPAATATCAAAAREPPATDGSSPNGSGIVPTFALAVSLPEPMHGAAETFPLAAPSCETRLDHHGLVAHRLAGLLPIPPRDAGRREQHEPPRLPPRHLHGGKDQRVEPLDQHVRGAE